MQVVPGTQEIVIAAQVYRGDWPLSLKEEASIRPDYKCRQLLQPEYFRLQGKPDATAAAICPKVPAELTRERWPANQTE